MGPIIKAIITNDLIVSSIIYYYYYYINIFNMKIMNNSFKKKIDYIKYRYGNI